MLLVNSPQDGMNLVVKEWAVLSRKPGVLIVSETAGVSAKRARTRCRSRRWMWRERRMRWRRRLRCPRRNGRRDSPVCSVSSRKWTARDWLQGQLAELGLEAPQPEVAEEVEEAPEVVVEREVTVLAVATASCPAGGGIRACARSFESEVQILKEGETLSGRSILDVLTANLRGGSVFTLRATGSDAEEAVAKLSEMLVEFQRWDE